MDWMIYGANGYTGELIAREAKRQGKTPILAGRSAAKIIALARQLNLPSTAFRIEVPSEIVAALRGVRLVLNCAGPFSKTADPLIRACLAAKAHYLDIAGEIDVLEGAHRFDADAKAAGVVLCPGPGFDVVSTDCIALMLIKAFARSDRTRARIRVLRPADVGWHRQDACRRIGQKRQNSPRWPHCRLSAWPRIAPHRFWPRRKAGDAHSMGRCRLGFLHHGRSRHHRLHANFAAVAGDRAIDQCRRTHPPITPVPNLAHQEDRKKHKRARRFDTQCESELGVGRSKGCSRAEPDDPHRHVEQLFPNCFQHLGPRPTVDVQCLSLRLLDAGGTHRRELCFEFARHIEARFAGSNRVKREVKRSWTQVGNRDGAFEQAQLGDAARRQSRPL
jgi:hypothetical protein